MPTFLDDNNNDDDCFMQGGFCDNPRATSSLVSSSSAASNPMRGAAAGAGAPPDLLATTGNNDNNNSSNSMMGSGGGSHDFMNMFNPTTPPPELMTNFGIGSSRTSSTEEESDDTASSPSRLAKPRLLDSQHTFKPVLIRSLDELPPTISDDANDEMAPPRPRRLWKVSDTGLRPFPPYYPRNKRCMRILNGGTPSPSVIAIRIAECLRRRGVAVEYDDEAATATCMTVDRCHFIVSMWRSASDNDIIIVEGLRTRGNLFTFHRTIHAVLEAAMGHDSGLDRRPVHSTHPLEYNRILSSQSTSALSRILSQPTKHYASALSLASVTAMESVVQLLRKDRLEAQVLGMERLVGLTDVYTSGTDTALYTALTVLGSPITSSMGDDTLLLSEIHEQWIMRLLSERLLPGEQSPHSDNNTRSSSSSSSGRGSMAANRLLLSPRAILERKLSFSSCASSLFGGGATQFCLPIAAAASGSGGGGGGRSLFRPRQQSTEGERGGPPVPRQYRHSSRNNDSSSNNNNNNSLSHSMTTSSDEHHGGQLRAMALRALTNSLTILQEKQEKILQSVLMVQSPQLLDYPLIHALMEDLEGASRPPAVVAGTRLASQHEAVLAIRCLRILGSHSDVVKRRMSSAASLLDKARQVGHSTHEILAKEAELCYKVLTEEYRSC